MLVLKILKNSNKIPETFVVENFPCSIGRSNTNDIVIDSDGISVKHCEILDKEEHYFLRDMGSTNKLFHDGEVKDSHIIDDGDVVRLGVVEVEFHIENEELDKTRLIKIDDLDLKHSRTKAIFQLIFKNVIIVVPLFLIVFIESFLFDYNYEFKLIAKEYIAILTAMILIFSVLIFSSKLTNGSYQLKRAFIYCVLGSIILTVLDFYDDLLFPLFFGKLTISIISKIISSFVNCFLLFYLLIFLFKKLKVRAAITIVVAIILLGEGVSRVSDYISDKDNYDFSSRISYPILDYSTRDRSLTHLKSDMLAMFEEVEENRVKKLKERNELYNGKK